MYQQDTFFENYDYRWNASKCSVGISKAYQKWFEKEFGLKIQKKRQNFEFLGTSFVFSFNFLYEVGPFRGGGRVKWPSNGLKFFSRTFYDISAQKKRATKFSKKVYFWYTLTHTLYFAELLSSNMDITGISCFFFTF